ncbi:MAG: Asp-tRNA(Asn)/Glu-tRNA(Gln) amidotransferase subunit GatC [Bacteroidota bacterium]
MIRIDNSLLHKVAHLARLEIDARQEAALIEDLNNILTWIEELSAVDTAGVEPLTAMTEARSVVVDDVPAPPLAHERGLRNAPSKDSNYFRVPQVKE